MRKCNRPNQPQSAESADERNEDDRPEQSAHAEHRVYHARLCKINQTFTADALRCRSYTHRKVSMRPSLNQIPPTRGTSCYSTPGWSGRKREKGKKKFQHHTKSHLSLKSFCCATKFRLRFFPLALPHSPSPSTRPPYSSTDSRRASREFVELRRSKTFAVNFICEFSHEARRRNIFLVFPRIKI